MAPRPGKSGPRRSGGPRKRADARPPSPGSRPEGPPTFRDRLRQDRFLFLMCLGFLFFATAAFALGWRVLGEPLLLLLAVALVPPAFLLFYLRDSRPA